MRQFIIDQLMTLSVIDENKLIKYVDFCLTHHQEVKCGSERHHILPSAIFKDYKNFKKCVWNCSNLLYKDHYIAHSLLAECISHKKVIYAWWNMNSLNIRNKKHNSAQIKPEELIGADTYSSLREKHKIRAGLAQHLRNKTPECIQKRKETMSKIGDDGLTGFKRMGHTISKVLIENKAGIGENNPMYRKVPVKERHNPLVRTTVAMNYDKEKYVPIVMNYMELYDVNGKLYFKGWRDECKAYCESIGLDSNRIPAKAGLAFNYNNNLQTEYLLKVMEMAGLKKYIGSEVKVIRDCDIKFN